MLHSQRSPPTFVNFGAVPCHKVARGGLEATETEWILVVGCSRNSPDQQYCVTDGGPFLRISPDIPLEYFDNPGLIEVAQVKYGGPALLPAVTAQVYFSL